MGDVDARDEDELAGDDGFAEVVLLVVVPVMSYPPTESEGVTKQDH